MLEKDGSWVKSLFKNAKIYDSDARSFTLGDLPVEDGIIFSVKDRITDSDRSVTDLDGAYVTPGFVDLHTHGRGALILHRRKRTNSRKCRVFIFRGV